MSVTIELSEDIAATLNALIEEGRFPDVNEAGDVQTDRALSRGRAVVEVPDRPCRRVLVFPYLIFYEPREKGRVVILRILDGRRDLAAALRRR